MEMISPKIKPFGKLKGVDEKEMKDGNKEKNRETKLSLVGKGNSPAFAQ